jgi:flavin-binding protein dodecin
MAIAKTIEVIAASGEGIESAIRNGVAKVGETIENIEGVWVKDIKGTIADGAVDEWRVTLAVTFIVD